MKASFVTVCASAAVVLVSALAETRSSSTIHPDSLARFEAITTYCGNVDPTSDSLYLSKLAGLTRGHSEEEIQRDRTTSKYQQAMAQAHETLAKVSAKTAIKACSEFLAQK